MVPSVDEKLVFEMLRRMKVFALLSGTLALVIERKIKIKP